MTRTHRLRSLSLLAAVAVASAAAVGAVVPAGHADTGHADTGHARADEPRSASQVAFHDAMRKLWEDHVTWTRLAIVSFAGNLPDLADTETRLLANQDDIGDAIKPFYGDAAGEQLSQLLRTHITTAVNILVAARDGDSAALGAAESAWYANADDIADFLSAANPRSWPDDLMRADMKMHLDQTLQEAVDRLHGHFAADIADYEQIHAHILEMADLLSSGIIRQFPDRFRSGR